MQLKPSALSIQKLLVGVLTALWLSTSLGNIDVAHAKTALIVAIGADNVVGHGIGHKNTGGVDSSEAFPAQLQALLRGRGIDARVINAGAGGDNSARMLDRLDSAVPAGTRLVILDRANGNDKKAGLKAKQSYYVKEIKARLRARHIAVIVVPRWKMIPGLRAHRDWDGHHFTVKGHAIIARYLLPQVIARIGR